MEDGFDVFLIGRVFWLAFISRARLWITVSGLLIEVGNLQIDWFHGG